MSDTHDDTGSETSFGEFAARIIAGVALLLLVTVTGLVIWKWPDSAGMDWSIKSPVEAGEYLGGVIGSAISLASALLFFAALLYQGSELKAQKRELRLQRSVAKQQAEAMQEQNRITSQNAAYERATFLAQTLQQEHDECTSGTLRRGPNPSDGWSTGSAADLETYARRYRKYIAIRALLIRTISDYIADHDDVRWLYSYGGIGTEDPPRPSEVTFRGSPGTDELQAREELIERLKAESL